MKRSPELRDLSEQHHYGLVAARALRRAAEGQKPLEQAIDGFLAEWEREIDPHFDAEEAVLLPAFAEGVGESHPLITRTLAEHRDLRRAVRDLAAAAEPERGRLAASVAAALHDHIRFEERVVFPAIEAELGGPRLGELGRKLAEIEKAPRSCPSS